MNTLRRVATSPLSVVDTGVWGALVPAAVVVAVFALSGADALAAGLLPKPNHPLAGGPGGAGWKKSNLLNILSSAILASLYDELFHHAARDERKSPGIALAGCGGGVLVPARSMSGVGVESLVLGNDAVADAVAVAMMAILRGRGWDRPRYVAIVDTVVCRDAAARKLYPLVTLAQDIYTR